MKNAIAGRQSVTGLSKAGSSDRHGVSGLAKNAAISRGYHFLLDT
jgi:hypothetical protein